MTDKIENIKNQTQLLKEKEIISPENLWGDDMLSREDLATKLTNLVRGQKNPYTISLHGDWGTGKTFLLKRWQKQLEKDGFRCIYYNAWEDDYLLHDPLVSIIGQLSHELKGHIDDTLIEKIFNGAKTIIADNGIAAIEKGINLLTGGVDVNLRALAEQRADSLLSEYSARSKSKEALKKGLEEMACQIKNNTGQPLVFIIDELDRCRPTFAVELLERVKHIFEIDNIVFVFGVNREQLCKTINSVYGDIDSDVYLRRFFDMEFVLPQADTEEFCKNLFDKHSFKDLFNNLIVEEKEEEEKEEFDGWVEVHPWEEEQEDIRTIKFNSFSEFFIFLGRVMNLSLRDIQGAANSMVFVGKNTQKEKNIFPRLIVFLIFLRLYDNSLYKRYISGACLSSEIMDRLHEKLPIDGYSDEKIQEIVSLERFLCEIDTPLQRATDIFGFERQEDIEKYLSAMAKTDPKYREKVIDEIQSIGMYEELLNGIEGVPIEDLARLIDLLPPPPVAPQPDESKPE